MGDTKAAARQKVIDSGLAPDIDESTTEWTEYSVQLWTLGVGQDLRVTLELSQAQAWKADYEANGLGYVYRIVEKRCTATDTPTGEGEK
jgi:hypothetical protein